MNKTLHVPAFINYACQICGWCCSQFDVRISEADYSRLSAMDWGALAPSLVGRDLFSRRRNWLGRTQARVRFDERGACAFLSADNRCLMHEHVGELGKALPCCVYPFTFAATPTGIYIGCRFSCRAMAYGQGEPLVRSRDMIAKQAALVHAAGMMPRYGEHVQFDGLRRLGWKDYLRFEAALLRVFLRDDLPLSRRVLLAWKLLTVVRDARLGRMQEGGFADLMDILEEGLVAEALSDPLPPPPTGMQRMVFRQFCHQFQHCVGGDYMQKSLPWRARHRLRGFWLGVRFALNAGTMQLKPGARSLPVRQIEQVPLNPLEAAEEIALSRFVAAKVHGKQYFGKLFYDYSVADGLTFLLLSVGTILWCSRAIALARAADTATGEDVIEAMRFVDYTYGYSPVPSFPTERMRVRMLGREDAACRIALAQFGRE